MYVCTFGGLVASHSRSGDWCLEVGRDSCFIVNYSNLKPIPLKLSTPFIVSCFFYFGIRSYLLLNSTVELYPTKEVNGKPLNLVTNENCFTILGYFLLFLDCQLVES